MKLKIQRAAAVFLVLFAFIICNGAAAKPSAVIFDCDGVLVDTEHLKYQAWQQALAEHDIVFTIEEYMPLIGQSSKKIMAQIMRQKKLTINAAELIAKKNQIYYKLQQAGVTPIPKSINFFKLLIANKHKYKIKVGLASSARHQQILENLKQIGVNPSDLDAIASGSEDLNHINDPGGTNKPKPYIYTLIANNMAVKPEECIVLEDSGAGVIAAADAGMVAIAIPDKFTRNHDFSKAQAIINFDQMTFEQIVKLAFPN
jgi:beta-phosphoglucomutase-like phosphatase (HAD superfamily)